jgi:hypothetical protein
MPMRPMRPMRVGETVDAAVALCRANFKAFAAIVAFVTVPLEFMQQLFTRGAYAGFPMMTEPSQNIGPPSTAVLVATGILSIVGLLVVRPFLTAAMIRAISAAYLGEPVNVGEVYRFALRCFRSILWVLFLQILALAAAGLGLALLAMVFAQLDVTVLTIIVAIGAVAVIAVLYVRWVLATAAVVVENARGTKALGRSWELTRSGFWRLVGTLLLATLLASIVGGILDVVPTVIGAILPAGWLWRAAGGVLSAIVTTPFVTAVTVLLYFDARVRREGLDISLMLREIVATP